jgi:hypothetical protein
MIKISIAPSFSSYREHGETGESKSGWIAHRSPVRNPLTELTDLPVKSAFPDLPSSCRRMALRFSRRPPSASTLSVDRICVAPVVRSCVVTTWLPARKSAANACRAHQLVGEAILLFSGTPCCLGINHPTRTERKPGIPPSLSNSLSVCCARHDPQPALGLAWWLCLFPG